MAKSKVDASALADLRRVLDTVSSKADFLDEQCNGVLNDILHRDELIASNGKIFWDKKKELAEGMGQIRDDLSQIRKSLIVLEHGFKSMVKREAFEGLKEGVEQIPFESFVSSGEFENLTRR